MRYFDDLVSGHFRAAEDAIGELVAVVSDAEGGPDRSIPQIAGDS